MNITEEELLALYSEKTIAHLLNVSPSAIVDLIKNAARDNFFGMAHRLFNALDADTVLLLNKKHGDHSETTGLDFLMKILSVRDFGPAEKAFLDEHLPKFGKLSFNRFVSIGGGSIPRFPHDTSTYAQVSSIANGCPPALVEHLMRDGCNFKLLGGTPFAKERTPLYASVLGAAIMAGNVPAFKCYLDLCKKDSAIDIAALPTVEISGGQAAKGKSAHAAIALYCPENSFADILRTLDAIKPISTEDCDEMLMAHMMAGPILSANTRKWNAHVIETIFSFRGKNDPLSDDVLQRAIINACYPILDEAARMHQMPPKKFRDAGNNRVDVVSCLIFCGAEIGPISRSLDALKSMGYDFNQKISDDMTALMKAAEADRMDILTKLLEIGIDPEAKTARGWTARSYLKSPERKAQYDVLMAAMKAKQNIANVIKAARAAKQP